MLILDRNWTRFNIFGQLLWFLDHCDHRICNVFDWLLLDSWKISSLWNKPTCQAFYAKICRAAITTVFFLAFFKLFCKKSKIFLDSHIRNFFVNMEDFSTDHISNWWVHWWIFMAEKNINFIFTLKLTILSAFFLKKKTTLIAIR